MVYFSCVIIIDDAKCFIDFNIKIPFNIHYKSRMFSNIFNSFTRVRCHSGSMSQKVGQGVIFVVTKRTTIYRFEDFKLVVIILQLCVISTLIVFQIIFTRMFLFSIRVSSMIVITNTNNRNWSSSPILVVFVVVVVVIVVVVVNLSCQRRHLI